MSFGLMHPHIQMGSTFHPTRYKDWGPWEYGTIIREIRLSSAPLFLRLYDYSSGFALLDQAEHSPFD